MYGHTVVLYDKRDGEDKCARFASPSSGAVDGRSIKSASCGKTNVLQYNIIMPDDAINMNIARSIVFATYE